MRNSTPFHLHRDETTRGTMIDTHCYVDVSFESRFWKENATRAEMRRLGPYGPMRTIAAGQSPFRG